MTLESKIGYSHQWSNAYYHVNFWCGFCEKIIQASHDPHKPVSPGKGADDNDASNHRWDHIGAHFDKGKLNMKDWTYWECPEKIGNLEDAKIVRDSYDGKENPRKEVRKKEKQMLELRMKQQNAAMSGLKTGEKRKATKDLPHHRSRKTKNSRITPIYWECVSFTSSLCLSHPIPSLRPSFSSLTSPNKPPKCECGNGPISVQNHASCPEKCGHQRCDGCEGNYARDGGEELAILRGPYDSWGRNGRSPGSDDTLVDGRPFDMDM